MYKVVHIRPIKYKNNKQKQKVMDIIKLTDTSKSILWQNVMITLCGNRGPTGIHATWSSTAYDSHDGTLQKGDDG